MFLASVPGSQSVTLEKKLKQAKAQPERKATKPAKRKGDMILKCSMKHQYKPFQLRLDVVAWQLL